MKRIILAALLAGCGADSSEDAPYERCSDNLSRVEDNALRTGKELAAYKRLESCLLRADPMLEISIALFNCRRDMEEGK